VFFLAEFVFVVKNPGQVICPNTIGEVGGGVVWTKVGTKEGRRVGAMEVGARVGRLVGAMVLGVTVGVMVGGVVGVGVGLFRTWTMPSSSPTTGCPKYETPLVLT